MRRKAWLAGMTAMAIVVFTGMASEASATASHVYPGNYWTIENLKTGVCEVDLMGAAHAFVADKNGDVGTWFGGGVKMKQTWTAGTNVGYVFTGTWKVSKYVGTMSKAGVKNSAVLVQGAVPGC